MRIPRKVEHGPTTYKVRKAPKSWTKPGGPIRCGAVRFFRGVMTINRSRNVSEVEQAVSFAHEIFHIIGHDCGINLSEHTVDQFARGWVACVRRNNLDFRAPKRKNPR
jgi:hypothetical protein